MKRIIVFGLVAAIIWTAENVWLVKTQPQISSALAVGQVNGGPADATKLRVFETFKDSAYVLGACLLLLAALGCFAPWIKQAGQAVWRTLGHTRFGRFLSCALLPGVLAMALTGGCMRAYDRPEYVEIDTSETGFLIPLEGDSTAQARFQSEDYLKQRKVAAKRVQITHRWSQEGRLPGEGRWIPMVRLVKVNRSPVTREWNTSETTTANGAIQRSDRAIWIESSDSVGFSMGFTCTAFIPEEDAAKFLYWYPSGSLADVMDREVRGRIQQVAAEVAAKYPLDGLRARKQEIADAVKRDVTNFFATRGISVTTVGMFGGMTYENPEIQRSIDQTFIAQQLKVVAEAKFEAQKKENERLELEAQGLAEKARRDAQGQADARKTSAAGEAEAIRLINSAASEAEKNPLLLQLKTLEVERSRIEKWDGHYPQMWLAGSASGGPNLMFQVPLPAAAQK
jgi:regulator of protease activity HflC (stomatin/prohibitin superfamily)